MVTESVKKIIPVAAGKGGVGKTFLTANLAIALAEAGHSTIAVDMDLGSANLHSFLGLSNRHPGIGDFLKARTSGLDEMLVQTGTPGLQFLPGDGKTPFLANVPYAQKIRLMRHVKRLPAEYILLDLGAGTSFNTLDFFRSAFRGILVITPDYPSIMSMLSFLKHLLLRAFHRHCIKHPEAVRVLQSHFKQSMNEEGLSMEGLQRKIAGVDPAAGKTAAKLLEGYRPRIVFNMGGHPDEIGLSEQIHRSLSEVLSIEADFFGFVFEDGEVRQSVKAREAFLSSGRESPASRDVRKIADRIVKYWKKNIENSGQLLFHSTLEAYRKEKEGRVA